MRRSSRLGRAAEMSAKIATNAKIPLRASKRVPRAAQVTSACADLTLAQMNCCRCLKDADDDVVEDDGKNDDDDDIERCVQTAKQVLTAKRRV